MADSAAHDGAKRGRRRRGGGGGGDAGNAAAVHADAAVAIAVPQPRGGQPGGAHHVDPAAVGERALPAQAPARRERREPTTLAPTAAAPAAAPAAATCAGGDTFGLPSDSRFLSLGLTPPLQAVQASGYTQPTPVQLQAIPQVLAGRDLLAGAQTGTGKTAAFALPLLLKLHAERRATVAEPPRALVLLPTRELAAQVEESFVSYGAFQHPRVTTTVIFGGVGQAPQVAALKARPKVVIATPGRLLDST